MTVLRRALSVLAVSAVIAPGCGGDEFSSGPAGSTGGTDAGASGSPGAGGARSGGAGPTGGAAGSSAGTSGTGGRGGASGSPATGGAAGGTAPDGSVVQVDGGGSDASVGCAVGPPAAPGIYVNAAAGSGAAPDGSHEAPFTTLEAAIGAAFEQGADNVYVAPGTYQGVAIRDFSKPLVVSGGWAPHATGWVNDCDPAARDATNIVAPNAALPGLLVEANVATVRLERVRIRSADAAQATNGVAGSVFGIIVRGADLSPTLALDDVVVLSGRGADGGAPGTTSGAGNLFCNGVNDCIDGGADGIAGSAGVLGMLGVFGGAGYTPGDGRPGTPGGNGGNGPPGAAGGVCTNCFANCYGVWPACGKSAAAALYGSQGRCGCGGLGGGAGAVGRGGGASVGILVAGEASVTATASLVRSGRGGDASGGAAGGDGGPGTPGSRGAAQTCGTVAGTSCVQFGALQCIQGTTSEWCTAAGGNPGGNGHIGGRGGRGGHGRGGPSFAVVTVGEGTWTTDGVTALEFGNSGRNGDSTVPAGNAGTLLSQ